MAIKITNEWAIDLPDTFAHRVEDEKLIFWQTGTTIIIAVYRLPPETGKFEVLKQIQENQPEDSLETFVSTQGEIGGFGYTMVEQVNESKKRLSLYTFTASDASCLQTAFYLDNPDDLDWAKSVWESIVFLPDSDDPDAAIPPGG